MKTAIGLTSREIMTRIFLKMGQLTDEGSYPVSG
jgi:hypothetical protein